MEGRVLWSLLSVRPRPCSERQVQIQCRAGGLCPQPRVGHSTLCALGYALYLYVESLTVTPSTFQWKHTKGTSDLLSYVHSMSYGDTFLGHRGKETSFKKDKTWHDFQGRPYLSLWNLWNALNFLKPWFPHLSNGNSNRASIGEWLVQWTLDESALHSGWHIASTPHMEVLKFLVASLSSLWEAWEATEATDLFHLSAGRDPHHSASTNSAKSQRGIRWSLMRSFSRCLSPCPTGSWPALGGRNPICLLFLLGSWLLTQAHGRCSINICWTNEYRGITHFCYLSGPSPSPAVEKTQASDVGLGSNPMYLADWLCRHCWPSCLGSWGGRYGTGEHAGPPELFWTSAQVVEDALQQSPFLMRTSYGNWTSICSSLNHYIVLLIPFPKRGILLLFISFVCITRCAGHKCTEVKSSF